MRRLDGSFFFFFNDTATTEIYTLSLHDALPISLRQQAVQVNTTEAEFQEAAGKRRELRRSEEHTSELQSPCNLVCRLLLEKKKTKQITHSPDLHTKSTTPTIDTTMS